MTGHSGKDPGESELQNQDSLHTWHRKVPKSSRVLGTVGLIVFLITFVGIGVWASTAEISGAVIASGVFRAKGKNKIVQHLNGGIIQEVLVSEGDRVKKGQVLIRLETTEVKAQLERLLIRRFQLLAMSVRLEAERQQQTVLVFPDKMTNSSDHPNSAAVLDRQRQEFSARSNQLQSEIAVLNRRITAIREEKVGLKFQYDAIVYQNELINEELAGQLILKEKGLTRVAAVMTLKREKARLEGTRGELKAKLARADERITEIESQIISQRTREVRKATEEVRKTSTEIADLNQRITAARDLLERTEITSPVKGVVVSLAQNTTGGVIDAGAQLIELLPIDEEIIIEAYVRPVDIDAVRVGGLAQLQISSLDAAKTPTYYGSIVYVSADTIQREKDGQGFYLVRIRMSEPADADKAIKLTPGMSVEVFIETGQRTVLQFIMKPLVDRVSHAFREY